MMHYRIHGKYTTTTNIFGHDRSIGLYDIHFVRTNTTSSTRTRSTGCGTRTTRIVHVGYKRCTTWLDTNDICGEGFIEDRNEYTT